MNASNGEREVIVSTERYEDVAVRAHEFFDRYLSEVAAANISERVRSKYELAGKVDAQLLKDIDGSYVIYIFSGLLTMLEISHAAVEHFPDSAAYQTYADVAATLSQTAFVKIRPAADAVTDVLRPCLFMALCFIAFHEFAHLRSGHFNKLYPKSGQEDVSWQACMDESGETVAATAAPGSKLLDLNKHMELEADLLAFTTLLGVSEELFMENYTEADERSLPKHGQSQFAAERLVVQELALYATCICLCLLELSRKINDISAEYPRPFTRILSVFRQFVFSTQGDLQIEEASESGTFFQFSLTEEKAEDYSRMLVNVIDLCNFCSEISGLEMAMEYQVEDEGDFLNDALQFAHLIKGAPVRTPEAMELLSLDSTGADFKKHMRPYRIEPWDVA